MNSGFAPFNSCALNTNEAFHLPVAGSQLNVSVAKSPIELCFVSFIPNPSFYVDVRILGMYGS